MSIAENIETVVSTFQKGRTLGEQRLELDELISELSKFELRYSSVAFEGASMGVALQNPMETWKVYAKATEKHDTQVHIGLGWAIAEEELDISSTLKEIKPPLEIKVLEGFGYWYGLFRRRLTIRTQQIPENISPELQTGFDQGVGRAIWYITKGEFAKVLNIINDFSESRKESLWYGIGVASTYVGGCSDELIAELKSVSGEFKLNFEKGIESAEESMRKAQF